MHHRHAVFDGDGLKPALLDIDVASGQARQNQCLLAVDEVTTVKLGGDRNAQAQPPHCGLGNRLVRHRRDEVAAKADEHLRSAVDHRLNGVDYSMSMLAWRLESKHSFDLVEQLRFGLLVDADRPISLHIRVSANRAYAGAWLDEIPAQQKQSRLTSCCTFSEPCRCCVMPIP